MLKTWKLLALAALVGFGSGLGGVFVGTMLTRSDAHRDTLDAAVHRELDLTPEQNQRLEAIEAGYALRKGALDAELRAAARDIAAAVAEDHAQSERLSQAIDRFHNAMGQTQRDAIAHVFEMRAVLNADQQARFDIIVREELLRGVDEE
ncbi:MAG: periplasmic heavy metal sensor [Hyphomonadaceae bacterium]|jgi:Spy/CpxP family protein refolding chaperone|nr:periplasmic heavy metal sensor [Hyphomonadaceae bacterium]